MTSTSKLTTRTGISLSVRPATEGDEAALGGFFDAVSEDDRRFRFFAASEHVSHEQLEPLLHADHYRSESFLAFDDASGELVASALLACDAQCDTAEIAVSIRSDYKGKGVGWALLDFLAGQAKEHGVRRVISIESRENHAAIELEREKGFTPEAFDDDPTLVLLSKTLR
ncbi:GNAT family N-acetyltransferase [Novosphingobium mangrovi (ex Huang et al. 2023)]|uniref:GNAT family N-acetyltransferase n=1 Tax=Novosphingobium mangrovi (ex Huang et al. 2023) TaxID=2976432 RepID=A0ABT2I4Y3_9SPHN|nr:GNAT family N-acetyltransferase [Novosphingobium mangrovi (ex Huang et al. 2023)]MCT2399885.1 GNAT family N-acetyltransferase [Novosphingobium mangrovi (ex Huang et al. 2023)]